MNVSGRYRGAGRACEHEHVRTGRSHAQGRAYLRNCV
jgi:hypothetical protein